MISLWALIAEPVWAQERRHALARLLAPAEEPAQRVQLPLVQGDHDAAPVRLQQLEGALQGPLELLGLLVEEDSQRQEDGRHGHAW
eukprot:12379238-Heterocapsa_arctica.AAC.1